MFEKKIHILVMLCLLIMMIIACSKTNTSRGNHGIVQVDCSTVPDKNFSANINPIIQSSCNQQSCHDIVSVNGPGPLTNYTQVFNARASVRAAIASGSMPQSGTLTIAQRNSIVCWIDGGAPNN